MQEKNNNTAANDNKYLALLKKNYERFLKIRGNPKEIALGFALGIFIGMTPYMGFQMAIAIFLAAVFKWNKFAAAAGAWISNPLTAPFLYTFTYYLGAEFLCIEKAASLPNELNLDVIITMLKKAPEIFWVLTVGGIILGIPAAVASYYISLYAILKYREKIRAAIEKEKKLLAKTKENIKEKMKNRKNNKQKRRH